MKNDNDLILERLRGVPAHKPSWQDKFETGNPNAIQTNDNTKSAPPFSAPQKTAERLPSSDAAEGGADTLVGGQKP